jgi:hypothetical protein
MAVMEKGMMSFAFSSICRSVSAGTAANTTDSSLCEANRADNASCLISAASDQPIAYNALYATATKKREANFENESSAQEVFISLITAANCANSKQNRLLAGHSVRQR